jgi:hypothetical protein
VTELERSRKEPHKFLQNPHLETAELAELGLAEWGNALPDEDTEALLDGSVGKPVRWIPEQGWAEVSE